MHISDFTWINLSMEMDQVAPHVEFCLFQTDIFDAKSYSFYVIANLVV